LTLQIAIDGPAASGKTAVGRVLARRLGARFLDTGTMYRAVAWTTIERGVDLEDTAALTELAEGLDIRVSLEDGEQALSVDGTDVTEFLRLPEVESRVSKVSEVPGVRQALVTQQRRVAEEGAAGIVMVGRDIGTVVLSDAAVKVFLQASVMIRVRRRLDELRRKGDIRDPSQLAEEIQMRDKIDTERSDSPLRPAVDSVTVETDSLRIDQVVGKIQELIERL
jgi:cytidylate kinase